MVVGDPAKPSHGWALHGFLPLGVFADLDPTWVPYADPGGPRVPRGRSDRTQESERRVLWSPRVGRDTQANGDVRGWCSKFDKVTTHCALLLLVLHTAHNTCWTF